MQTGFVAVDHDQLGRIEGQDLTTQLGPDRAPRAGDDHPFAAKVFRHAVHVGLDGVAPQQVSLGGGAEITHRDVATEQLRQRWHDADVESGLPRGLAQLSNQRAVAGRNGDHERRRTGPLRHRCDRRPVAEDSDAPKGEVSLRRIVIQQGDGPVRTVRLEQHRP